MIRIGIDTGGTCTDAVIYEQETDRILASAKTQTTRRDLKIGILKALKKLPEQLRAQADYVTLSTTLATNACVENKGARAGLILIGAHPKAVEKYAAEYGLPPLSQLCLIPGRPGQALKLDRDALAGELTEKFADCESLAVVQIEPDQDGGALERQVERLVEEVLHIPCVLGHQLFQERNILRRGASTLLNARLQPVMSRFLKAVSASMDELGLSVPVYIVRSDGSLMSREFAATHPVETLLCGPASSVIGGQHLAPSRDALIVDMGGTTTDISVVQNGLPRTAEDGIRIGSWSTMVHGVYIHTLGLGGDSRVVIRRGTLELDHCRCIPLCALAAQYPDVLTRLSALVETHGPHSLPLHEFLVLAEQPAEGEKYPPKAQELCRLLEKGPLSLEEAACALDMTAYDLPLAQLEREGVILRAGFTPTDVLHLRGQFEEYDRRASRQACRWLSCCLGLEEERICALVEQAVVRKLCCHLIRVLLEADDAFPAELREDTVMEALTEHICRGLSAGAEGSSRLRPEARAVLVGIGAPTRFYLPEAARLLGMQFLLPDHAATANALGAAVSGISAHACVEIRPLEAWGEGTEYELTCSARSPVICPDREQAVETARDMALELAAQEARRRGALGELETETSVREKNVPAYDGSVTLRILVTARASAALSAF